MLIRLVLSIVVGLLDWGGLGGAPAAAEESLPPTLQQTVAKLVPGVAPDRVAASPIPGLYEVVYGPNVFYLSGDGRFLVRGDVIDLARRENVTEQLRKQARVDSVNELGDKSMIVFAPEEVKHTVSVFTDVECPYCQKLHREMEQYHRQGIAVRYLAFPRSGVPSPTYDKMVSVWCAEDPRQALTDAKAGKAVPERECENPVEREYDLGRDLGVRGTPTIVTEDGSMIPGYVPAEQLARRLDGGAGK